MLSKAKFNKYIIKEYPNWTLFLAEHQWPHVGRCYAWWKDRPPVNGENLPLSLLTEPALAEVFQTIFADVCRACHALGHETEPYGPNFLLNTCYLANNDTHNHHMHVHFLPRFRQPLEIKIGQFVDRGWGGPPTFHDSNIKHPPEEQLQWIRSKMAAALGAPALTPR